MPRHTVNANQNIGIFGQAGQGSRKSFDQSVFHVIANICCHCFLWKSTAKVTRRILWISLAAARRAQHTTNNRNFRPHAAARRQRNANKLFVCEEIHNDNQRGCRNLCDRGTPRSKQLSKPVSSAAHGIRVAKFWSASVSRYHTVCCDRGCCKEKSPKGNPKSCMNSFGRGTQSSTQNKHTEFSAAPGMPVSKFWLIRVSRNSKQFVVIVL